MKGARASIRLRRTELPGEGARGTPAYGLVYIDTPEVAPAPELTLA